MNADFIVIGLGNPGARYSFTRHNIGFIALDLLAHSKSVRFSSSGIGKKIDAEVAEVEFGTKKVLLIKPQTFMNLSGQTLAKLFQLHQHLRSSPIVCLHDEVDLPLGKVRIKEGGGDAGHNGLKSLRSALGHGDYCRIRMGVGRPEPGSPMELADYVLQNFSKAEEQTLIDTITKGLEVLEAYLQNGLKEALSAASRE